MSENIWKTTGQRVGNIPNIADLFKQAKRRQSLVDITPGLMRDENAIFLDVDGTPLRVQCIENDPFHPTTLNILTTDGVWRKGIRTDWIGVTGKP